MHNAFMRIMGLDVGDKTVGVAVSDPLGMTAQPITTIRYDNAHSAFAGLTQFIREYEVTRIIVGLPLNMNGSEGPQAAKVRQFMENLASHLERKIKRAPEIIFWDERLSTVGAERALLEADISRAKRKKVIDKMAAVFILQGYLESIR